MAFKKSVPGQPMVLSNCTDCQYHVIRPDPDPDNPHVQDLISVYCLKSEQSVAIAVKPHEVVAESLRPDWCPLG